jgi:glycine C-acetyltransferase
MGRVDILTGTRQGPCGASGGYTAGPKSVIDLLRQRSGLICSRILAPAIVAAPIESLNILKSSQELPERLRANTAFSEHACGSGLDILPGEHPIVPVMIGDAIRASQMAEYLLQRGVYVIAPIPSS